MLRYVDTDIVFQEIPDEVTLAVNLSGCPCHCPGCHSPHLWGDTGLPLDNDAIDALIRPLDITCLSLMGGDAQPAEVDRLFAHIRRQFPNLHTAWYSGRSLIAPGIHLKNLDYLKLGPYLAHLGGLRSPRTNQRLYRIVSNRLIDITSRLQRTTNQQAQSTLKGTSTVA